MRREESVPVKRQAPNKGRPASAPIRAPKKRVKIDYGDMEVSEYYLSASKRCRAAKYVSFLLLIAFLAVHLLFFRENITYANLMYLLRDLDTGVVVGSGEFASISYTEESSAAYGAFKGRLAVASSSGFKLYNSTGARELDERGYMQNPALALGEKYAIAYDLGGHSYNIYTTMACVYEGSEENVIEDVCVADNGSYAIMTRSNEERYLISVYKDNMRLQSKHYKKNFPCDIALSPKGDALAILSANVSVSGVETEIMLCVPGTEEKNVLTISGSMPLAAKYTESGSLIVVCDNKIAIVENGEISKEAGLQGKTVGRFAFGDNSVALSCSSNTAATENIVMLFGESGEELLSATVGEKINGVCASNEEVFLLCEDKIKKLSVNESEREAPADASVEAIVCIYGGLIKCEKLGASSVSFEQVK